MKLKEIKKQYDTIVSLGINCQTAHQLKKNGLRSFSGPFDWFVFDDIKEMGRQFETGFSSFFLPENTVSIGAHEHNVMVKDELSGCLSYHDFPLSENVDCKISLDSYNAFKKRFNKRLKSLIDRIQKSSSILFVRNDASFEDAAIFNQYITNFVNRIGVVDILVVNASNVDSIVEIPNDHMNICHVEIPAVEYWQGHDESWQRILEGITINPKKNMTYRKSNQDIFTNDLEFCFGYGVHDLDNYGLHSRWLAKDSQIFINSDKSITKSISFTISTFHQPRNCKIYLNGREIFSKQIKGEWEYYEFSADFKEGINELIINADSATKPKDIPSLNSGDNRELSFRINSVKIEAIH